MCTPPPTLRQNFRLVGVTFGGSLNHNSGRNTGAKFGIDVYACDLDNI